MFKKYKTLAIISFVLSLLPVILLFLLITYAGLTSYFALEISLPVSNEFVLALGLLVIFGVPVAEVLALIFGIIVVSQTKRNGDRVQWLAITSIIIATVFIVLLVLILMGIIDPYMFK